MLTSENITTLTAGFRLDVMDKYIEQNVYDYNLKLIYILFLSLQRNAYHQPYVSRSI